MPISCGRSEGGSKGREDITFAVSSPMVQRSSGQVKAALGGPRTADNLSLERPVALEGVRRVWCCSTSVRGKVALLNIVATRVRIVSVMAFSCHLFSSTIHFIATG